MEWTEEERKSWNTEIRKTTKADKRWHLQQIQGEMNDKEKWSGSETMRREFKQNVDARRDKGGQLVELGDRAEAMATYLQEVHWGKHVEPDVADNQQGPMTEGDLEKEAQEAVANHARRKRASSVMNVEMDTCIRKIKRSKAAGTDEIRT